MSGGLGHGSGSSSGGSGGSRAGALLRGGPWRGLSLGNVPLFPLRTAAAGRLNHTEAELRAIIQEAVRDLAAAGGNLLRVWFHIDGSMSPPAWAQEAQPAQPAQQFGQRPPIAAAGGALSVADLKWLLRLCHRSAVKVLLVLWSHDMLAVRRDNPPPSRDRALHMVTTAAGTAAYIRNCLSPLVQHLAAIAIRDQDDADGAAPAASEEGTGCGPGSCCSSNCCRGGNPAGGVSGGGGGSSGQRVEPGAFSGTAFPALRSASNSSSGGASWGPCVLSLSHGVEPAVQQNQTKEGGPGSTDDSLHSRDSHGGGGGGGGGGGAPTYSSVLLGYELLNEPEGMSWELRLYHNYMYDTAWGLYQLEDPDWYGRQVARRGDYRTLQVLKACGGLSTPAQGRDDLRDYTGWHFVGGNRPLAVARGNGSRTATSAAPCISRGSLLDPAEGVPSSPRLWFNRLMYIDVIAHHNSELPYLLPLATGCRLRTVDVSVRRLQRFVSRLAAAVHAADPAALVTVGSHSPPYCSDAQWLVGNITEFEPRPRNLFSDAELRRAFVLRNGSLGRGWDATGAGTLDFYAPHGYPYWGHASVTRLISPFHVSARQYQLDKPALIGEFWDQVSDDEALTSKHWGDLWRKGGYVGGLGWAMLQVVEDPNDAGQAGNAAGTGWTLAAPRRLVGHEKRAVFLRLLREMRAGGL
ncbi:hypothetical protein HXX76_004187 [Chlamydomonas incerta]|uniref:Uncharacterized protein n=1 Tax=Chlamydomonas incerta TaxID=51695 RepID=A0A835TBF1_CHLIN|nr:hypothetical protein HXX76_004187 [Chlamydomonas incerta]|eukprot:KAG2440073.1 hypothetical protein HXX76_004187 [Chlamydomonas incerta]